MLLQALEPEAAYATDSLFPWMGEEKADLEVCAQNAVRFLAWLNLRSHNATAYRQKQDRLPVPEDGQKRSPAIHLSARRKTLLAFPFGLPLMSIIFKANPFIFIAATAPANSCNALGIHQAASFVSDVITNRHRPSLSALRKLPSEDIFLKNSVLLSNTSTTLFGNSTS